MKTAPRFFSLIAFVMCLAVMPGVMALDDTCFDFEDLSPNDGGWSTGDSFVSQGQNFTLSKFYYYPDGDTDIGDAWVDLGDDMCFLPGTMPSQALWLCNVNVGLDLSSYSEYPQCVRFDYWQSGGNLNLEINGDLLNEEEVQDFDGQVAGDVVVRVISDPDAYGYCGTVELRGVVQSLKVGGQEFYIDNLCLSCSELPAEGEVESGDEGESEEEEGGFPYLTSCVDFNTVSPDFHASLHDEFLVQGVPFTANEFFGLDGTLYDEGSMWLGDDGGIHLSNSNLGYELQVGVAPANCLSILCNWGFENIFDDNVNLEINGTLLNKRDIMELDGEEAGDVTVQVVASGEYTKLVQLFGAVSSFKIGGKGMDILEICPECSDLSLTDCVNFEALAEYTRFEIGQNVMAGGVVFSTSAFYFIDGEEFSDGSADVYESYITQKPSLFLSNISVGYDFASYESIPECVSIFYEASGGNKNLEVNGVLFNKDEMNEFDGLNAGDVLIRVIERDDYYGVIQLQGPVSSFKIGGQEVALLEICPFCKDLPEEYFGEPLEDCIDFTTLEESSEVGIWEELYLDDILFETYPLGEGAYWTYDGVLTIGDPWEYGVGLWLDNINIGHDFTLTTNPAQCVSIYYIDSGGDKNLQINGEHRYLREENFAEVHGEVVGDVMVYDAALEGDARVLVLQGPVSSFQIGGQELYLSKICPSCGEDPEEGEPEEIVFFRECVNFWNLPEGFRGDIDEAIVWDGVEFWIRGMQYPDGSVAEEGEVVEVVGEESSTLLGLHDANLTYDFSNMPPQPECMSIVYYFSMGLINLRINDDIQVVESPEELDGQTIGGVSVRVEVDEIGRGTVLLVGTVYSFAIGGENLFLEEICPFCEEIPDDPEGEVQPSEGEDGPAEGEEEPVEGEPVEEPWPGDPLLGCVNFSDLPESLSVGVDEYVYAQGVALRMSKFFYAPNDTYEEGVAFSDFGEEGESVLFLSNINVGYDFSTSPSAPQCLTIAYGYSGGTVNLEVNGILKIADSMAELDPGWFDGVTWKNYPTSSYTGILQLQGDIHSFNIGGEEFYLTEICPSCETYHLAECVNFSDLIEGQEFENLATFLTDNTLFETTSFKFSDGEVSREGTATVIANGDGGLALALENINVGHYFSDPTHRLECVSINYVDHGGDVNLIVNNNELVAQSMMDLNGQVTDDGVAVAVSEESDGTGIVVMSGAIGSFFIGGENLVVLEICPFCKDLPGDPEGEDEPDPGLPLMDCVDFTDVPPNSPVAVNEYLYTNGVGFLTSAFVLPTGESYGDGSAGLALDEDGQDVLLLNHINLGHSFANSPSPATCVSIAYGYLGGNINLEVNGIMTAVPYLVELDGTWLGNVRVRIFTKGFGRGVIQLQGDVTSFKIGGEWLVVSEICPSCDPEEVGAHGADWDGDFLLDEDEVMGYIEEWEEGHGDLAMAIRALYLQYVSSGHYDFDPSLDPPECFIPVLP